MMLIRRETTASCTTIPPVELMGPHSLAHLIELRQQLLQDFGRHRADRPQRMDRRAFACLREI